MLRYALRQASYGVLLRVVEKRAAARTERFYGVEASSVVTQMIQYSINHFRSQRSEEAFSQAKLVLEQGLSNAGNQEGESSDNDAAVLMLAISTLLYERGAFEDAADQLKMIHTLERAVLPFRVAAFEGLVGLSLEAGEDVTSSMLADESIGILESRKRGEAPLDPVLRYRAEAIKGLTDLVLGRLDSAKLHFGTEEIDAEEHRDSIGSALLSCGEYQHIIGNFSNARNFYDMVLQISETKGSSSSYLAAANMADEEVLLATTCALGQLLSHYGNFTEAEEWLTKALTMAKSHFGSHLLSLILDIYETVHLFFSSFFFFIQVKISGPTHPKVGVVLTCIALMFKHKAQMEASSSILIQEGLYRGAIDLLKAPSLDDEVDHIRIHGRDVLALARGGYADVLMVQEKRKEEGRRMRKWAEIAWGKDRLSLADALEFSDPSNAVVLDTRIKRVL